MRRDSDIDNNHDDYSDSPLDPKYAHSFHFALQAESYEPI